VERRQIDMGEPNWGSGFLGVPGARLAVRIYSSRASALVVVAVLVDALDRLGFRLVWCACTAGQPYVDLQHRGSVTGHAVEVLRGPCCRWVRCFRLSTPRGETSFRIRQYLQPQPNLINPSRVTAEACAHQQPDC
jgi:hypothetical protein